MTPVYASDILPTIEQEKNAKARASFLKGLWGSWRNIGQRDVYADVKFNLILRARAAVQVAWVKDRTPESLRPFRPAISLRSLDPKQIGYLATDDGMVAVYRTYSDKIGKLAMRYPEIKDLKETRDKKFDTYVQFIDFWYQDDDGVVWNAYLINGREFLRPPRKSTMPIIPIIVRSMQDVMMDDADSCPAVGFLDGMIEEWEHECMIESMIMSGLSRHFFKPVFVTDDTGEPVGPLSLGTDAINEVSRTTRFIDRPNDSPDFQSANGVASRVTARIQKSTFNDAMFGDGGSQRSGFAYGQMQTAGMSRLSHATRALRFLIMHCNSLALCMVKKFATEPETIYGYDKANDSMSSSELRPEQIPDSYENHVEILTEDNDAALLQRLSIGLQMVQAHLLSPETFRDRLVPFPIPEDEDDRILAAMALGDPDVLKARIAAAYERYYGIALPQGEPDMQPTQQQPQGQVMQPGQSMPGMPMPPQAQGQMTPEAMMGNADADPLAYDMAMGQQIDPSMMLGG